MAVYTTVDHPTLERLLRNYQLGTMVRFEALPEGIDNTNYLLETDQGRFILTLFETYQYPSDLDFFLTLMEHLAKQGLPCPVPIYSHNRKRLNYIADCPAAIVTFLEGESIYDIQPQHCQFLGRALAEIHIHGMTFPLMRENTLSRPQWYLLFSACRDYLTADVDLLITDTLTYVSTRWPHDLPKGVIHADLFPDNVLFQGTEITGLIDFYASCTDFLAYDLAICIDAWCFDAQGQFDAQKASQLIIGYTMTRPLSDAELNALPILLQGSTLRFLLTRLYNQYFRAPPTCGLHRDPNEYVLRLGFQQGCTTLTDYAITLM